MCPRNPATLGSARILGSPRIAPIASCPTSRSATGSVRISGSSSTNWCAARTFATPIAVLLARSSFISNRRSETRLSQNSRREQRHQKICWPHPICDSAKQMQNSFSKAVIVLVAGVASLCSGLSAQTSGQAPATPPGSAAQPTPAAKSATGATAKPRAAATASAPLALTTQKDKASYAIGMNIGKDLGDKLHKDSVDVNTAILLRGIKDSLAGGKMLLTDEQAKAVMDAFVADLRKKQEEKMAVAGSENKTKGDAFLAANKTKDGVVTLPSGLQYKIITT